MEVTVAEAAPSRSRNVTGWSLIIGSILVGLLVFTVFPMPQEYSTVVGGEKLVYTTECTVSGNVLWDPEPAFNPDHVAQAEDYCAVTAAPVLAISLLITLGGVLLGAWVLTRSPSEAESAETIEESEPAAA